MTRSRGVQQSADSVPFHYWATPLALCLAACIGLRTLTVDAADIPYDAVARVLDTYSIGQYDDAVAQMARWTNFRELTDGFRKEAPKWIASGTPDAQNQRRQVVAVVALEMARLGFIGQRLSPAQWDLTLRVIEFGCTLVRRDEPAAFERLWLHGSVSLLHGAQNYLPAESLLDSLRNHLKHARSRFPADGRLRLAEVLMSPAARRMPNRPGTSPWSMMNGSAEPLRADSASKDVRKTTDGLRQLLEDPDVGAEARLRYGILLFHQTDLDASLADLQVVTRSSGDPYVVHVAYLYIGLVLDSLDRRGEAMTAYESALRVIPYARSASVALAEDLFVSGRREESAAILQAAFSAPAPHDPWHEFSTADYRFWPTLLRQLREAVRS